jgi:hypothetical protein
MVLVKDNLALPFAHELVRGAKHLFVQALVTRLQRLSGGHERIQLFLADRVKESALVDRATEVLLPFFRHAAAGVFSFATVEEIDLPTFGAAVSRLLGRGVSVQPISLSGSIPSGLTRGVYWSAVYQSVHSGYPQFPWIHKLLFPKNPGNPDGSVLWQDISGLIEEHLWHGLRTSFSWLPNADLRFETDACYGTRSLIVWYLCYLIDGELQKAEAVAALLGHLSNTLIIGEKADESNVWFVLTA